MVTRRDFLKTMSMASAGLALGTGDLLHAQTVSPKKGRGDKVRLLISALVTVESRLLKTLHGQVWWKWWLYVM